MNKPKTTSAINKAMDLIAEGQIDTALGVLWRLRYEITTEGVNEFFREPLPKFETVDLPPMKPIKKKINPATMPFSMGKEGTSVTVSCPTCHAEEGEFCFRMNRRGFGAVPTKVRNPAHYHPARTVKARGGE